MYDEDVNLNPALGTSFQLIFPKFNELNYSVQSVDLPSISVRDISVDFMNNQATVPGNVVNYEPLQLTFQVNEDFSNYIRLNVWLLQLHQPRKNAEGPFKPLEERKNEFNSLKQDVKLVITDSNKVAKFYITFYYSYITSLSGLKLDSTVDSASQLEANMTLKYQYYSIEPIPQHET